MFNMCASKVILHFEIVEMTKPYTLNGMSTSITISDPKYRYINIIAYQL